MPHFLPLRRIVSLMLTMLLCTLAVSAFNPVRDAEKKKKVFGEDYYYVYDKLYDASGKVVLGDVAYVTENYVAVKNQYGGGYYLVGPGFEKITPDSYSHIEYCTDGKSEWFVATPYAPQFGRLRQAKYETSRIITMSGKVFTTERAGQAAWASFKGDQMYTKWGDERIPIKGATRAAFKYNGSAIASTAKSATNTAASQPKPAVTKNFPSLEIVEGSLKFKDRSGRDVIDANGAYAIEFAVKNVGKGAATGCQPKVTVKQGGAGIKVGATDKFSLAAGAQRSVTVPLTSEINTADGTAEFVIRVDEPQGFGTDAMELAVSTKAFVEPQVVVNDYTVTSATGTTLKRKIPFDLQLLLQNVKHGAADDVQVSIRVPENVFIIEGSENVKLASLKGGEIKDLVFTLVANANYASETIPVEVSVREKYGKYAEGRRITLSVDQPLQASRKVVEGRSEQPRSEIAIARLNSDVDTDLPRASRSADDTFVVIIANEDYSHVASVPYAANDGHIFAQYCRQTLGVPERNIRTATNATLNEMKFQLNWLAQVGRQMGEKARAIVYYSGHGVPDESTGKAYLLPSDGYHSDMGTNMAVTDLYSAIGEAGFGHATIFLDACFSGAQRGDEMLMAARGVALKARSEAPRGRMTVFSAAQGDETAYPYDGQRHGLFTYYLLKKLQATGGNVTLGDLADYISAEVGKTSLLENSKLQTPQVQVSSGLVDSWRTRQLMK